jgi:hypothetical protein
MHLNLFLLLITYDRRSSPAMDFPSVVLYETIGLAMSFCGYILQTEDVVCLAVWQSNDGV